MEEVKKEVRVKWKYGMALLGFRRIESFRVDQRSADRMNAHQCGFTADRPLELAASRFRALSGPTKHSSYVKGNWWVECCFRG